MEKRSRRRTRDPVTQPAFQGLSENEIGCARISIMARSTSAPFKGRIQNRKTYHVHSSNLTCNARPVHTVGGDRLPACRGGRTNINKAVAADLFSGQNRLVKDQWGSEGAGRGRVRGPGEARERIALGALAGRSNPVGCWHFAVALWLNRPRPHVGQAGVVSCWSPGIQTGSSFAARDRRNAQLLSAQRS